MWKTEVHGWSLPKKDLGYIFCLELKKAMIYYNDNEKTCQVTWEGGGGLDGVVAGRSGCV